MNFWTALKGLKAVGFGPAFRGLLFTFKKRSLEREMEPFASQPIPETIGNLTKVEDSPHGARFSFERAMLEVDFRESDLPIITWTPGLLPVEGMVVIPHKRLPFEILRKETARGWELSTTEGTLLVHPEGSMTWFGSSEQELIRFQPPARSTQTGGWRVRHSLPEEGAVYGLGQRTASINLRGGRYRLWNQEPRGHYGPGDDPLYLSVPFYWVVSKEHVVSVLMDNSSETWAGFRREAEIDFATGAARFALMSGSPSQIMNRYTGLTGRPAMPPLWSLGYHQCRWSYLNETEVRELVEGFKKHKLPVSAIHLDIHYMDGYRVFTVDSERFPDLKKLSDELHKDDIRLVTILDPGIKADPDYHLYNEAEKQEHLLKTSDGEPLKAPVWPGMCVFPDFTRKETRRWWGDQYQKLLDWGVDGVWHDMNEPAAFTAWGDSTLPTTTLHDFEGRGGDHLEGHNLFALGENRSAFEGLLRLRPDRRPWLLSRSGWAGNQRYAWNWTGDCEATWWTVHQSIRMAIGLGLSGIPYTGPDIGGFSGNPDAELYARWFQMAAFLPFFRTHSAAFVNRREPWTFGEETTAIAKRYLELRYQLLPYWYTLAREAHRTGAPPVRPMFWCTPHDNTLWEVDDQFMVGDGLLVAPVLEPGATNRSLVLPDGLWFSLHTDGLYRGDRSLEVDLKPEDIPVFVRGGSILPLAGKDNPELHIYLDEKGEATGVRFLDSGDGYDAHRTEHWAFQTQSDPEEDGPDVGVLSLSADGDFMPEQTDLRIVVHGKKLQELRFRGNTFDLLEGPCTVSIQL